MKIDKMLFALVVLVILFIAVGVITAEVQSIVEAMVQ